MNPHLLHIAPLLAQASKAAYLDPSEAKSAMARQGLCEFKPFRNESTDIEGFVALSDDVCVIAFRGTDSLKNWLTDGDKRMVKIGQVSEGAVKVHEGFWNALESVNLPDGCYYRTKKVYITGHSLGGALAMLCAYKWVILHDATVVTFGQPRVGNKVFADYYDSTLGDNTLRVVHQCDIVPRIPIHWLWWPYWHTKNNLYFDSDGKAHLNMPEWRRLRYDVADLTRNGLEELCGDHAVKLYAGMNFRAV